MHTVGIVACSNAQRQNQIEDNQRLINYLENTGRKVIVSPCIYEKDGPFSGTGTERAKTLMDFFTKPEVEEIYDISGGDMANEILDELDFDMIRNSKASFWGYSDLTTVINAIYAMTGKSSVLYQVKHLVCGYHQQLQSKRFENRKDLFTLNIHFVQGNHMNGIVIGGNIRCFLKLAGTKYFPDTKNKILLLEANSGEVPQMVTYLSQLKSCGVFEQISGILLGTFTQMEAKACEPDIITLVKSFVGEKMPIAVTAEIGHGSDAKAIRIGEYLY